jgi:hypothetical protein
MTDEVVVCLACSEEEARHVLRLIDRKEGLEGLHARLFVGLRDLPAHQEQAHSTLHELRPAVDSDVLNATLALLDGVKRACVQGLAYVAIESGHVPTYVAAGDLTTIEMLGAASLLQFEIHRGATCDD